MNDRPDVMGSILKAKKLGNIFEMLPLIQTKSC